jgi:hypothetical protein
MSPGYAAERLRTAERDNPARGSQRQVGESVQGCPEQKKHWIEVQLIGEDDRGIGDAACHVTGPDGILRKTKTDSAGLVRIDNLPAGNCEIRFPHLDRDVWDLVRTEKGGA